MSDQHAITSGKPKETRTISTGDAAQKAEETAKRDQQMISVVALKTFHKDSSLRGEVAQPGDEFEVPRVRAAELRANGLIEYASENDEKAIHGEEGAERIAARIDREAKMSELPEEHKTTPLRNPKLELAEVEDEPDKPARGRRK